MQPQPPPVTDTTPVLMVRVDMESIEQIGGLVWLTGTSEGGVVRFWADQPLLERIKMAGFYNTPTPIPLSAIEGAA